MFKIATFLLISILLLRVNTLRLYGNRLKKAEELLNRVLARLIHEDGPIYSQHGVDAAYKFVPNIIYTFDTILEDWRNDEKRCLVALSYAYTKVNVLTTIKCENEKEVSRTIINEKIFVPEDLKHLQEENQ